MDFSKILQSVRAGWKTELCAGTTQGAQKQEQTKRKLNILLFDKDGLSLCGLLISCSLFIPLHCI